MLRPIALSLGVLLVAGCAEERTVVADPVATAPDVGPNVSGAAPVVERRSGGLRALFGIEREETTASLEENPALAWAHRPEGERWTEATLVALQTHGAALPASEPDGIEAWCPAYAEAPLEDREAFWAGLISALAKHESTWRPEAVGGGGRWFGLVQIAPGDRRRLWLRRPERGRAEGRGGEPLLRGADHGRQGPRRRAPGALDRLGLGPVPLRRQARRDARLGQHATLLHRRHPRGLRPALPARRGASAAYIGDAAAGEPAATSDDGFGRSLSEGLVPRVVGAGPRARLLIRGLGIPRSQRPRADARASDVAARRPDGRAARRPDGRSAGPHRGARAGTGPWRCVAGHGTLDDPPPGVGPLDGAARASSP